MSGKPEVSSEAKDEGAEVVKKVPRAKRKKPVIAVAVVGLIVVLGVGFSIWHE